MILNDKTAIGGLFMSKYQAYKDAIEAINPGGASAPILISTTTTNDKVFNALIGRKIKSRPLSFYYVLSIFIILAVVIINIVLYRQSGTPVVIAYVPLIITFFMYRTTLISINDDGLVFYCVEANPGPKYDAFDQFNIAFDRIDNVKIKTGRFNTNITFGFIHNEKKYYYITTVPNRIKKIEEQAQNIKYMLETLERKNVNII